MSGKKLSIPASPQVQLALQLGIATLMVFAGVVMVLGGLGIIQPDTDPGTGGRMIALLFGALVAVVGLGLILVPLRVLAAERGAAGGGGALFLGLQLLLRRVDVRSVLAAASLVPLVWGAWFALNGTQWIGPDRETIIDLVTIEFLLIHGFPFLAFAATLAHTSHSGQRKFGLALVVFFVLFYALFAWQAGGPWGILGLVYLSLPNILAFSHADNDWKIRTTAVARWLVKTVTFLGTALAVGHREIQGAGNLDIALFYFALQAFIEAFRVAEIPLDLGIAWERLPPQKRPAIWAAS